MDQLTREQLKEITGGKIGVNIDIDVKDIMDTAGGIADGIAGRKNQGGC